MADATPAPAAGAPAPFSRDPEHLKLLAIFYFVQGGLWALGALLMLFYTVVFGVLANVGLPDQHQAPEGIHDESRWHEEGISDRDAEPSSLPAGEDPEEVRQVLIYFAISFFVLALLVGAFAAANIFTGFFLLKHRRRVFTLVVACINLIFVPIGTALGVFTLIVLLRDSVVRLYGETP